MVVKKLTLVLVFVFLLSITLTTSTDFSQDLGRHLAIGSIILKTGSVPSTNLFSYTNPAFPFTNHHWLSEVLFSLAFSGAGPAGLMILKVACVAASVYMALRAGRRYGILVSSFVSLAFIPLLFERLDVRPELFGYFLFSLVLYILYFAKGKRAFAVLPPAIALWSNFHISFVFGLFLLSVYAIFHFHRAKTGERIWVIVSFAAACLNPQGLAGALYPFRIFGNYGYSIVENQNMFFLNSLMLNYHVRYYFLLAPVIAIAFLALLARKRYSLAVLLGVFSVLPVWQLRHLPFFVFAAIPTVTVAAAGIISSMRAPFARVRETLREYGFAVFAVLSLGLAVLAASNTLYRIADIDKSFGIGFAEREKGATDFIRKNKLPGNLFNNFDIGGYAIYRLYPDYRVFVDNRPEAYPADFFRDTYIKLQEDDSVRKKVFSRYGIHTVLFTHTDITPWGRTFMEHILKDPKWKLVYADDTAVVFTDEDGYRDIREDKERLAALIKQESDYLSLMRLMSLYLKIQDNDLAGRAFMQATLRNGSSCAVKRILYQNDTDPLRDLKGGNIRSGSWWCF